MSTWDGRERGNQGFVTGNGTLSVASASQIGGSFRVASSVMPVGVFRKGLRGAIRDAVLRRSLDALRPQRHRSGWPLVVAELDEGAGTDGILLDDFVERTFHPAGWGSPTIRERLSGVSADPITWQEPWIGIFHYPHHFPEWFQDHSHPRSILSTPRFKGSQPYLRGAIALSEYLAEWLRSQLSVPVVAIKHPTPFTASKFTWDAFLDNRNRSLVQVGWFLRNYRGIYQVAVPDGLRKAHLAQDQHFIIEAQRRTDAYSPYRSRAEFGDVDLVPWQTPSAYDRIFTENIMFLELFDASANNVVIEAIARETPIVVNRHPAVMEYLGPDYPLAYGELSEVPAMLDLARIKEAHHYLRDLDKSDLTLDHFVRAVDAFAARVR